MTDEEEVPPPGANPEKLLSLVSGGFEGRVVVPEFQRNFVWDRESVEELITSLLNNYFVGTLLILDTPAHTPMFPYRVLEGVSEIRGPVPERNGTVRLVLDGQQRLTSLFYALHEPPIALRGTTHPYHFFVRLESALAGDLDEAVVGVSTGWSTGMARYQQEVNDHRTLPLPRLSKSDEFYPWLYSQDVWPEDEKKQLTRLHQRLADFMIPVVSLVPETGAESIVNIFEHVNRTGIPLKLFDLIAARLYLKDVKDPTLHGLWDQFSTQQPDLASQVGSDSILRVIALLEGRELKKGDLLSLDSLGRERFLARWTEATTCLTLAWERMRVEYGAANQRLVPYGTMLLPLAVVLNRLKSNRSQAAAYRRLDIWYWRSVFAQRYESGVNNKTIQDVQEIGAWCEGGDRPLWLDELDVVEIPLDVEAQRSAVYRGILCLTALAGARDFCTGESISLNDCQDDHIFPKAVYAGNHPVNGIMNRAFIRSQCNNLKPRQISRTVLPRVPRWPWR